MIRAIAFDLDDTLYPEQEFVFSGYRAVADEVSKTHGFDIYPDLIARFTIGERGDLFTPTLTAHLGFVEEDYVQLLVAAYRQHEPVVALYPEGTDGTEAVAQSIPIGTYFRWSFTRAGTKAPGAGYCPCTRCGCFN